MDPRPIQFLTSATGGRLLSGSGPGVVRRICTDSRACQEGDLFVALVGERFDGHQFLTQAAARGAAALLVQASRPLPELPGTSVIEVDDTRRALGLVAAAYRRDFTVPVIAVAGSNGKTSTKELVASVLRQKLSTLWSEASFNNDIGVPLTLLRLDGSHAAAVLEIGTNHPGELEPLVQMAQPQYGIITTIGGEHLEFFGDISGVVTEEGHLAELLPGSGKLFINGDIEWAEQIIKRTRACPVRLGHGPHNEYRLRSARLDKTGVTFRVDAADIRFSGEYRIQLMGRHQAVNALFAIAAGVEFGLSREQVEQGLADCKPAKMRMQFWELNGVRVLDDCYNANVDSMHAALRTLQELPCKGRRVAVLGDMAELGTHSDSAHEQVGRIAAESGVGQLFAVGKMAAVMARGARSAGLNRILEFPDADSAATALKSFVKAGDILLLKASRATRLERISELLRNQDAGRKN